MTKAKSKGAKRSVVPDPEKVTNKTPSPPAIKEIGGSGYYIWDMMMIDRTASTSPTFMAEGEDFTKKMAAIAMRAFQPADAVEGMLASQAIAMHHASMECSRRAMLQGQPGEVATRLRRDAANSARCMTDMVDALARYRGKGTHQVIRVEKMMVADGGQAVVGGTLTSGVSAVPQGVAPLAIGNDITLGGEDKLVSMPAHADVQGEGE